MGIAKTLVSLTVTLGLVGAMVGCGGGGGDNTQAFCKTATTSSRHRNEVQINAYYDQLKKVAPKEVADDIATLRSGWKRVNMSLGDVVSGHVQRVSRPPEVSTAAKNVVRVVSEKCGVKNRGVYVVLPESGF